jgi:electron transport complex protein RnfE
MKKNNYGKILKDGILTQNPVLVQVLGMCPTLAVSTRLMNGLGMGAAVTAVLICSNLFISLLRKVIDKRIRIASFIVIIAGFVTMVEMLMKAFMPSLSESLGVYIPLIVVNCIILARAEAFASRNRPLPSVVDGLACGLGFTGAICIVSTIREVLGTGALLGYDFKLIPPIMIFSLAPGGLLVLGLVMAFCAWISKRRKAKAAPAGEAAAPEEAKAEKPAKPEIKPAAKEPQLDKAAPVKPLITVVETKAAEAAEEIAPAEASPVQGDVSPQATEGLLTSDKPQPAEEAESADTGVPQGEGSPADTGASKPEAKPAANTQLTFDTEEDGLEPPSFMAEPVTRPRDKKEGR